MRAISKRRFRKAILLSIGLAAVGIFLFGPQLIQTCYSAFTPEVTMQQRRAEYQRLEEGELHLTGAALVASAKARYKLSLWFSARGFSIDGDAETEPSFWEPWQELFDYWRGDDGARFFPTSRDEA